MLSMVLKWDSTVVKYDLSGGAPRTTVAPTTFIEGKVDKISGKAFDPNGNFYASERKKIMRFPSDGSRKIIIDNLPDYPEFIRYVSESDLKKGT